MKQIFLVQTASSWGRGWSIGEAINNCEVGFLDEFVIQVYTKIDPKAEFTKEEYESVRCDAMNVTLIQNSTLITLGKKELLNNLNCIKDEKKFMARVMEFCEEKKMQFNAYQLLEKAFKSIGIDINGW